jgi:hypothetical protein
LFNNALSVSQGVCCDVTQLLLAALAANFGINAAA